MNNSTEEELNVELDHKIDSAIMVGIRRGKKEFARRRKLGRRRLLAVIATFLLISSCLFTIKVSPVFAAMVSDIPGLDKFVAMINNTTDKGIKLALDNEFIQPVGISDEHEGAKFTVQGIIADESRMLVFYDIQLSDKDMVVQLDRPSLSYISGEALLASYSFNNPDEVTENKEEAGIQHGTIDIQLPEGTSLPNDVVFKVQLKKSTLADTSNVTRDMISGNEDISDMEQEDISGTEFNLTIPVDQERFTGLQSEYIIGETIQVEGQSINFAKAIVTPLRISLYVNYDEDNSKQIFGPGDIHLVDDEGTVWRNISGDLGPGRDHQVYHFESSYFKKPKSLMIGGSWFRALDKNQLSVIIDTEKGQLLKAPDEKLSFSNMVNLEGYLKLDFALSFLDAKDNMMYSLFEGEFTDGDGNHYKTAELKEIVSGYKDSSEPKTQHSLFYVDKLAYKQPLTLTIYDYPAYIHQDYTVMIK